MVGRTVMIVLFCAVLFIVGVYVTLYFVDWEKGYRGWARLFRRRGNGREAQQERTKKK
jgi:hypothetical protein